MYKMLYLPVARIPSRGEIFYFLGIAFRRSLYDYSTNPEDVAAFATTHESGVPAYLRYYPPVEGLGGRTIRSAFLALFEATLDIVAAPLFYDKSLPHHVADLEFFFYPEECPSDHEKDL